MCRSVVEDSSVYVILALDTETKDMDHFSCLSQMFLVNVVVHKG